MTTTLQSALPKTTELDSVLNAVARFFQSQRRINSLPTSVYLYLYKSHGKFGEYDASLVFQMNSVAEYRVTAKNHNLHFELLGADYPGFPPTVELAGIG